MSRDLQWKPSDVIGVKFQSSNNINSCCSANQNVAECPGESLTHSVFDLQLKQPVIINWETRILHVEDGRREKVFVKIRISVGRFYSREPINFSGSHWRLPEENSLSRNLPLNRLHFEKKTSPPPNDELYDLLHSIGPLKFLTNLKIDQSIIGDLIKIAFFFFLHLRKIYSVSALH